MSKRLLMVAAVMLASCGGDGGGGSPAPPPTQTPAPPPPANLTPTLLAAPAAPPLPAPGPPRPASEWAAFVTATVEQYFTLNPGFAVFQGRHDFDGLLPDWSDSGIQRTKDFLRATYAAASGFTGLDASQQFERDYLLQILRSDLFVLEDTDSPHTDPDFYVGDLDPTVYLSRDYADAATRMRATIAMLSAVPAAAARIRANLRIPMPTTFIAFGVSSFNGFADFYTNDVRTAFAGVADSALQQDLLSASTAAATAMRDLATWLNSNAATGNQAFALGPERFSRMLSVLEGVDVPLAELRNIGEADLIRNQVALTDACTAYAPGQTVPACLAKLAAARPADGPIAAATRQIDELRAFVVANDIVTIPNNETIAVRASPPYRANVIYMQPPGAFEAGASTYYIPAGSGASETVLLYTSVHEAMPGHFLQFLHARNAPSLIGRLFVNGGFAEGWAHYTEEMMLEAGLRGTPEARLGQILNALLRNCRYLAAIGMHTQGMTVADAQLMFQQRCFQDANTAALQANRGTFDPGYLDYTLNKLMILRLRNDWTASRGGRAAWRAFHDQFLSYGGPTVPQIRAAMMGGSPQALF